MGYAPDSTRIPVCILVDGFVAHFTSTQPTSPPIRGVVVPVPANHWLEAVPMSEADRIKKVFDLEHAGSKVGEWLDYPKDSLAWCSLINRI